MRLLRLIIITLIISQILTNGKTIPALAAGINAVSPVITNAWQKQTVIDKEVINKDMAAKVRLRMVAFVLPKIKRAVNIDKIVEDLARLKRKVQSNI